MFTVNMLFEAMYNLYIHVNTYIYIYINFARVSKNAECWTINYNSKIIFSGLEGLNSPVLYKDSIQ